MKVLRADPLAMMKNGLLSIGREVLEKRKLSREMHGILTKRCAALTKVRDDRRVAREEWQLILDDPGTKHHCRDVRQESYARLAASESHAEKTLSLVGASRRLLAAVFTGVHDLLRKTVVSSGTCGSNNHGRRVNALQMLGVQLCGLLAEIGGDPTAAARPGIFDVFEAAEAADWPLYTAVGWRLRHGQDVSAPLAVAVQALFRGFRLRRGLELERAAVRAAARTAAAAAAAVVEAEADGGCGRSGDPAQADSVVRYDAGLDAARMQRSHKSKASGKRRRRRQKGGAAAAAVNLGGGTAAVAAAGGSEKKRAGRREPRQESAPEGQAAAAAASCFSIFSDTIKNQREQIMAETKAKVMALPSVMMSLTVAVTDSEDDDDDDGWVIRRRRPARAKAAPPAAKTAAAAADTPVCEGTAEQARGGAAAGGRQRGAGAGQTRGFLKPPRMTMLPSASLPSVAASSSSDDM